LREAKVYRALHGSAKGPTDPRAFVEKRSEKPNGDGGLRDSARSLVQGETPGSYRIHGSRPEHASCMTPYAQPTPRGNICYSAEVRPLPDPSCPSTPEQLLLTGANAVCGVPAPRNAIATSTFRTEAALGLSVALGLAFAWALVQRRGLSPTRLGILLVAAILIATPGLRAVWLERGDAPLHADASAKKVATLVGEIDAFASARDDCLQEVRNDCLACQPLMRFALPVHTSCAHPRGRIELRPDALSSGCTVRGDTLECGSSAL
jgi:hypothetical protein